MNKVKAFIERGNDGIYSVYVDLEDKTLNYGIHGNGKTAQEAIEDFYSAYEAMKAFYKEKGKEFIEAEFELKYDLASFLQYYSKVFSYASLERLTGVNQSQLSQYVQGYRKPSRKTAEKIEYSLHQLAHELQQVQFV